MTGKEILEEEFEKAGMRGYKADQVDEFLRKVAAYVDEQDVEKNDLVYKIKILADKIEEYKADEGNIRDALLGAQKLGTSIVNEAKTKAEALTKEARYSADELMAQTKAKSDSFARESMQKTNMDLADLRREFEKERINLDKMKREISSFKTSILKQYKSHLDMLTSLPSIADDNRAELKVEIPTPEPTRQPVRAAMFDQDTAEEITSFSKEPRPIMESQTVTSAVLTATDELEMEEREQTKEFGSKDTAEFSQSTRASSDIEQDESPEDAEEKIDFSSFGGKRVNYMEKFGELKFGGFGKKDE